MYVHIIFSIISLVQQLNFTTSTSCVLKTLRIRLRSVERVGTSLPASCPPECIIKSDFGMASNSGNYC